MAKVLVLGVSYGFGIVAILFMAMMHPGVSWLAEWLLAPGYFLPEAYWGAAHDPVQIFLAFLLNVMFYGIFMSFYLWLRLKNASGKIGHYHRGRGARR